MLVHDIGVLSATTAFGKTVLAAWLIAQRGVNTLILVHRQQLLEQWVERLNSFLDVSAKSIGRLGGGRRKLTGVIDVALMQSLVRKDVVDDRVSDYGHLVVDDSGNESSPAERVMIIVDDQRPTAILTVPSTVFFGQAFTLFGNQSFDVGGGQVAQYIWTSLTASFGNMFPKCSGTRRKSSN